MADPTTKTFGQIVAQQAAAVQAYASGLLDFSTGAILRAVSQSVAALVLWLQGLILQLLANRFLSTADDASADSFVADFGGADINGGVPAFARLPAAPSSGRVTFSRLTPTGIAIVLIGATVQTADGTQTFAVTVDLADSFYDPTAGAGVGGYAIPDGTASHSVPVKDVVAGAGGNVLATTINTITSPITGIDRVTNPLDFTNGFDAEKTPAMALRFRAYAISLREATPAALKAYVEAIQPGVVAKLVENTDLDGTPRRGFFYIIVDDGSGDPPSPILDAASKAADAHRAAGIQGAIIAPTISVANVAFGVTGADGDDALAVTAVTSYIDRLSIGQTLYWSRLYQVAFDASPTITDVSSLLINGGVADLAAPLPNVIKAGTVTA